jgi:class 3 adenylate cyclase
VERLGRLRRFVSPQVAETLMSRDAEATLSTHRKQIAVFMCDLRGFTRFSASAEPEEVVEVLNDYFGAVGQAVEALGATVGGFAGDGVLVYFNDPFPVEDPPGKALAMATALRAPMDALAARWVRHGFKVGYGIGIAYGYATMSTIGFDTRSEYTPIGPVVNLASRLCDQAGSGEVLLDLRAYEAVRDRVNAEPVSFELKGFDGEVTAFRVALDSVTL